MTPEHALLAETPSVPAAENAARAIDVAGEAPAGGDEAGDAPSTSAPSKSSVADGTETRGETEVGFSRKLANQALTTAAAGARRCRRVGDPNGLAYVEVTFAPSGKVVASRIKNKRFSGTSTAKCINTRMGRVEVPAFEGENVTIVTTVNVL